MEDRYDKDRHSDIRITFDRDCSGEFQPRQHHKRGRRVVRVRFTRRRQSFMMISPFGSRQVLSVDCCLNARWAATTGGRLQAFKGWIYRFTAITSS